MSDAVAKFMSSGKQGGSRRRTGRADVKIAKPHALMVQSVEVRRLENRISVTRKIAIPLIIRDQKDDIWYAFLFLVGIDGGH